MTPDPQLSARRGDAERQRLAELRAAMDEDQRQAVIAQTKALLARQAQEDDPEILPKVTLQDVPLELPELSYREQRLHGRMVTSYEQGTNGLVYQQLSCPLPALNAAEFALLPQLTGMAAELGVGSEDYLATQRRQSATVGSINLFTSMRGEVHSEQSVHAGLVLSSKALHRQAAEQAALMRDTLTELRFDELPRIRDLVAQQRARREQSLVGQGHTLAMHAACAAMSPLARLHHELSGLAGVTALRRLDERIGSDSELQELAAALQALYGRVRDSDWEALLVAEPGTTDALGDMVVASWKALPAQRGEALDLGTLRASVRECWVINSQVSFCATAYPTVPVGHADAAALTVLAGYLRNGFLHRAIREQGGAYGGGASHDASVAAFRFYSYRDPRIGGTLDDFEASIAWLRDSAADPRALEEAILGVIGSLDRPGSPAGEAKQDFHNRRFGRDHAQRMAFRRRILAVTFDDLQRVAATYLVPEAASIAVVTGAAPLAQERAAIDDRGLAMREL
jgi:Zn-dependent M16 (insulinase) family peptidase